MLQAFLMLCTSLGAMESGTIDIYTRFNLPNRQEQQQYYQQQEHAVMQSLEHYKQKVVVADTQWALTPNEYEHIAAVYYLTDILHAHTTDTTSLVQVVLTLEHMKKMGYDLNKNFLRSRLCVDTGQYVTTVYDPLAKVFESWHIEQWPLIEACRYQKKEYVDLLLAYGADVTLMRLPLYNAETACSVAKQTDNAEIIQLIQAWYTARTKNMGWLEWLRHKKIVYQCNLE